ncbi:8912_t:CDS:2 [Cetraspora pellucida]|uniref:8912_t:CDS:1 n=1 Tax=Cetraspora pellucida TaxID=1433469 RepID=A0A9N9K3A6_9GLOM|nr:8912_t:CDS:2 [Cetraspora pellucida]
MKILGYFVNTCILSVSSNDSLEDKNDDLEMVDLINAAKIEAYTDWCLKEKQKKSRELVKWLMPQVKSLLKTMFHTGTASLRNKMLATEMQQELLNRSREGEINEADMPKVSTISNWISGFSRTWKRAMAERSLEENKVANSE